MSSAQSELPVLPLRQSVLFPGTMLPVAVARPRSLAMLEALEATPSDVVFVTQRDAHVEDPTAGDLFSLATRGRVVSVQRVAERGFHVVVKGLERVEILEVTKTEPFFKARVRTLESEAGDDAETDALSENLRRSARELLPRIIEPAAPLIKLLESVSDGGQLADVLASTVDLSPAEKVELLGTASVPVRMRRLLELLRTRRDELEVSNEIDSHVKEELTRTQREHYLRQQMKAIREELGEGEGDPDNELDALEERLQEAKLSEAAEKAAERELKRLKNMQPASIEYSVARTYLEWLADLPWAKSTTDTLDLADARRVLDEKHYGLENVKKRIVEFLAVRKLKSDLHGPILCLVGPPGVGKTSLAQAVAETMHRKIHRVSLGGVRDEAEIRGHRRTYVGALPGRIVQGIKKAGTNNPVFVLDEIDKLAHDMHGDPSSALLEVLDPEQNSTFSDHYLEVAFDLSRVLFIATANRLDPVPPALRDRMEVIELPGYTEVEKRHIARRHLLPKVLAAHGLTDRLFELEDAGLEAIIQSYTREAGVRNLERQLTAVVRGVAVKVAEGKTEKTVVGPNDLAEYLGPEQFEREHSERMEVPGVAIGLAWTEAGGDILFVEATRMAGRGQLTLTGQLGDVMKESVQAARSYIRARATDFGVQDAYWEKSDIHVHVPAGAVPKDGPSAGITMVAALASLITGIRVKSHVAMTGELTLRGHVLPVGGIKEKVLAAHRAGVRMLVLPERNKKDLVDVPDDVKQALEFHFVSRLDEALDLVLERPIPRKAVLPPPPSAASGNLPSGARA